MLLRLQSASTSIRILRPILIALSKRQRGTRQARYSLEDLRCPPQPKGVDEAGAQVTTPEAYFTRGRPHSYLVGALFLYTLADEYIWVPPRLMALN